MVYTTRTKWRDAEVKLLQNLYLKNFADYNVNDHRRDANGITARERLLNDWSTQLTSLGFAERTPQKTGNRLKNDIQKARSVLTEYKKAQARGAVVIHPRLQYPNIATLINTIEFTSDLGDAGEEKSDDSSDDGYTMSSVVNMEPEKSVSERDDLIRSGVLQKQMLGVVEARKRLLAAEMDVIRAKRRKLDLQQELLDLEMNNATSIQDNLKSKV